MDHEDIFTDYKPFSKAIHISDLPDGTFLNVPLLPMMIEGKGRKTYRTTANLKKPDSGIEVCDVILNQHQYDCFDQNPFQMKTTNDVSVELVGLTK